MAGAAEAHLAQAEERGFLDAVLDAAGSLVCVFDAEGRILRFNRACEALTGYSFEEVRGRLFYDFLVPPAEIAAVKADLAQLRPGQPPSINENNWVTRDGRLRLISWRDVSFFDEAGRATHLISTGLDVTDQRRAEEALAGIEAIGTLLAKRGPTAESLSAVLRTLSERMGYRYMAVFLAGDERPYLGAQLGYDALANDFDPTRGIVGRTFRTGISTLVTDVTADPDYLAGHPDLTCEIAVPLTGDGATLGVLSIESTAQAPLTSSDLRLAETVAERLSVGLVLGREQQVLEDRARLFGALNQFAHTTSAILDSERLWSALVAAVGMVIPAQVVALIVFDPDSGRYVIRAASGLPAEAIGSEIRSMEGVSGRAIALKQVVVGDTERGSYPREVRDLMPSDAISSAAVPMIHDGGVMGAIFVARPRTRESAYSPIECEVLDLLGAQAALALANARLVEEVRALAIRDPLTGLFNRRHFDASVDRMLARWTRDPDGHEPISAIMFDLDQFRRFNGQYGHQAGDAVLRAFAGVLQTRFRSADLVARYGGEEFVAILEGATRDGAVRAAEDIRVDLASREILGPDGQILHATVSAGCAEMDPTAPTREALLKAADVGLFMAKRGGRNQVVAV